MFSRVIYICNARAESAQNFSERQRKLSSRFSALPWQIFGLRLLSYSKSLVWSTTMKMAREREGGGKGGKCCLLKSCWRLMGRLIACLGCDMKIDRERESRQAQLVPRWNCSSWVCVCAWVCVLSCVGQAGNYDNAKVCQVATTKSVR